MKNLAATILQYAIRVLAVELGLALIVGVTLVILQHTLNSFGDWMFWAGLIVLVTGLFSVIGHGSITRGGTYTVGQTVGEEDILTRTNAELKEEKKNFSFLLLATGVGILAIILSQLV
jgi:hypothetical protein